MMEVEKVEIDKAPEVKLLWDTSNLNLTNRFDKGTYPNCWDGHNYAAQVVKGEIDVCVYVRGACVRYIRDINHSFFKNFQFEADRAEHYLVEAQKFHHVIGTWATPEIKLSPWQKFIWMNIFGFINKETGFRRFRTAHLEVPRGHGKSTMSSQCALYMLGLDPKGGAGPQVSTVATKKDQARIVLDFARAMALKSKEYCQRANVKVRAHDINGYDAVTAMKPRSAEAGTLDGLTDILAVLDELHKMKRDVYEVITSGMSKRRDSLVLAITTAGDDITSVGYSESTYSKRVCLGEVEDEQRFAVIYTVDANDDWTDESVWRKANPEYGNAVDPITFKAKFVKAQSTPADVANVKIKHLNMWVNEAASFYDAANWDQCSLPNLSIDDFKGEACIAAIDKANYLDLNSISIIFERGDDIFYFDETYCPAETIKKSGNDLYLSWKEKGHLIETPGEVMNHKMLKERVVDLSKKFNMIKFAYDPFNAVEMAQDLELEGVPTLAFNMNVRNFSEATKTLDQWMRKNNKSLDKKRIWHNGNPMVRWCVSNVVCTTDHNDNVFPKKNNAKLKIDPVIALIMCIAVKLQHGQLEQKKFTGFGRV